MPDSVGIGHSIFSGLLHFVKNLFGKLIQILWDTLFQDAAFGAGEDCHQLSLFAQELFLEPPQDDAVPDLLRRWGLADMLIQDHGMIPVEAAEGIGCIGVDAHLIEDVGADLHLPGLATQQADGFIEIHLHFVVFGPIFNGPFHGNTVGDIAKGAVEFFFLLRCQNIAVDFDIHLARSLVLVEESDVVHEPLVIHPMPGKVPVLLGVNSLYADVQTVQTGVDDLQAPLRGQQGGIGGGVHPEHFGGRLGVAHHICKPGIDQRLALLVKADDPDGVGEVC